MRRLTFGLVCVVAAATLAACSRDPAPGPTLEAFLAGWHSGNMSAAGFVAPDGQGVPAATVAEQLKALSGELAKTPPALRATGEPRISGDLATADVAVAWPVGSGVSWDYTTTVQLSRNKDKQWQVVWAPTVVHPKLAAGDVLGTTRVAAPRAGILDSSGAPLVTDRTVYRVGVEKKEFLASPASLTALDAALKAAGAGVNLSGLPGRLAGAKDGIFVEVVVLREEPFNRVRAQLEAIDGVFLRKDTLPLAESREFARALLGTVGEVTKEMMDAKPGVYSVGDEAGLFGLQKQHEDRLRGTPGLTVVARRTAADSAVTSTELWKSDPKPGAPLKLTLDPAVQRAADAALRGLGRRGAIVALGVKDGAVLAVANTDDANLALEAQVPPGSTFKIVTAYGVMSSGAVVSDTPVACPATLVVDGKPFRNAHGFSIPGSVPFHTDFARSCNTAFASLAPRLGPSGLADAGRTLGIGVPWDLGVPVYSGSVATGGSQAEQAAAAFGQGRTQVSPISLAAAAAAVARGQWQQPRLLSDPAPASPASVGPALVPSTVDPLRQMMREVVTSGTASDLSDVPGAVYGKTGTAEFDNANPDRTHAWFVGWRGDIAFAVFVFDGGDSTSSAVPLAEKFLRAVPSA
jgi:cell division protein FtsI/penicillin-binding protein 2